MRLMLLGVLGSMVGILATATASPAPGPADQAPSSYLVSAIAVKGDLSTALGEAVTNQICLSLAQADKGARVVCPDDLKALLQAQGQLLSFGAEGASEELLAAQAATIAQADRVISGSLSRLGKTVLLQLTLLDQRRGTVLARSSRSLDAGNDAKLLAAVPEALVELFKARAP